MSSMPAGSSQMGTNGSSSGAVVLPVQSIEGAYTKAIASRAKGFVLQSLLLSSLCNATLLGLATGSSNAFLWHLLLIGPLTLLPAFAPALLAWLRILLPGRDCNPAQRTQPNQDAIPLAPSSNPASQSLRSTMIQTLLSRRSVDLMLGYGMPAGVMLCVYRWSVMWFDESLKYGVFASTPRHPYHLNENTFCLFWGVMLFAGLLAVKGTLNRSFGLKWNNNPNSTVSYLSTLQSQLRTFLPLSESYEEFTLSPILGKIWPWLVMRYVYPLVYTLSRKTAIVYLLRVPLVGWICRPFIVNFTRPSHQLDGAVGYHLGQVCLMVLFATDMPLTMLRPYISTPVGVAQLRMSSNSGVTVEEWFTEGLKTKNQWFLHLILTSFKAHLSSDTTLDRLFTQDPPSPPAQAQILNIWQQLLIQLGRRHALLLALRAPPSTSSSPSASSSSASYSTNSAPMPQSRIIRDVNVLKPLPPSTPTSLSGRAFKSFTDVLAGGEPIVGAPPLATQLEVKAQDLGGRAVRAVSGAAARAGSKAVGYAEQMAQQQQQNREGGGIVVANAGGLVQTVKGLGWKGAVGQVRAYWGREWARRGLDRGLRDVEVLQDILDCFVTITQSSVHNDRYGYVQTVVPGTMEAIVKHHSELSAFHGSMMAQSEVLGQPVGAVARRWVEAEVGRALHLCERAIYRIAQAYGSSFKEFSFPPHVQQQLQGIIDKQYESAVEGGHDRA